MHHQGEGSISFAMRVITSDATLRAMTYCCASLLHSMLDLCCVRHSHPSSRSGKCCRHGQQRMQLLCGRRPETSRLRAGGYKRTGGTKTPQPTTFTLLYSAPPSMSFLSAVSFMTTRRYLPLFSDKFVLVPSKLQDSGGERIGGATEAGG